MAAQGRPGKEAPLIHNWMLWLPDGKQLILIKVKCSSKGVVDQGRGAMSQRCLDLLFFRLLRKFRKNVSMFSIILLSLPSLLCLPEHGAVA